MGKFGDFLGSALGGLVDTVFPFIGQARQETANMDIAKYQAAANERYMDKYNAYNTPANQMQRFEDAGLNKHLIYGQGSPGNQSSPLTHPDIKSADYQSMAQILPMINQTKMVNAQVQATNAKTRQTTVLIELNKLQAKVLEKNPLLNDTGFAAIIDSLKSTAEIKAQDVELKKQDVFFGEHSMSNRLSKVHNEVELLIQRFHLGTADLKIKAEVLKSMEFKNAILEVQKKFMTDSEITPQHIYEFAKLLLIKLF